jgi:hypothetical protein
MNEKTEIVKGTGILWHLNGTCPVFSDRKMLARDASENDT